MSALTELKNIDESAADGLDLEALRQKYREERDKRLQYEDRGAYIPLEGALAERFDVDPWATTDGSREAVTKTYEAVVLGGGFGGLLSGAYLRKAGVEAKDICIVDRGSNFGGTWYWNRYPGLSCDTESYVYLPLLEETGYIPTEKYAKGAEIREHCERIGKHFGLYESALFQTLILDAHWDEGDRHWVVKTDRGDVLRARYLYLCRGGTSFPKLPGVPGISDFEGHSFHTMRWDYNYTGGSQRDPTLSKLADKRVALIGTGATAIQCVPPLGQASKELYVFQRTPSAVIVRANRPTDAEWAASLEPGWQRSRMENFLNILAGVREKEDLVDDGFTWTLGKSFYLFEQDHDNRLPHDVQEKLDFATMHRIRARVDEIVKDKDTAESLKPWYGILCKRPCFHDEYLQTFNRPNVTLVNTQGRGLERITKNGIIANGREYELDCIIYSTGFGMQGQGAVVSPRGVDGVELNERLAKSMSTLHGITVNGYPNLFVIGGPQGTLAVTLTYGLVVIAEHAAKIVAHAREIGATRIEATPEGEQMWQEMLADKAITHKEYYEECTPGFYNAEGKGTAWQLFFGEGPVGYSRALREWADGGMTPDLAFT